MKSVVDNHFGKEALIEILVLLVFEKAKRDSKETAKEKLAQHLNYQVNNIINERTFIRYYDGYLLGRKKYRTVPRDYNLDELSKYLGYKSFEIFKTMKDEDMKIGLLIAERIKIERKMRIWTKIGVLVILFLLTTLGIFIGKYYKKNCMIWVEDHFEKIRCSGLDLEEPLNPLRLTNFRKVEVCKDSIFIENGKPIKFYLRYGGGIEFFTYPGPHPVYSEKFVGPVTLDIIRSRVKSCDSIL